MVLTVHSVSMCFTVSTSNRHWAI